MNAINDLLGFTGRAADAVLLGGTVGKTKRRNEFADMLEGGDYASAADFALRHGRDDLAQMAAQRGAQAQQGVQKAQDDENAIFSGLSIALSEISDPNARRMAFEAMKPGLSQRYGLDENDFSQVPLDDANALRLFGQQFIKPETQAAQLLTRQSQAETARSNVAGERLRGGELGVSQGRLGLDRERLAFDRSQVPAKRADEQAKLKREDFKDTQALRKEFSQITSDYRDASGSYDRIKTLAQSKTSQADLALIVAFTKLLDPGSVAREGEVQLTQTSASAVQQVGNWYNRLASGKTILPDAVRDSFVAAAEEIKSSYDKSFDLRSNEFKAIASDAGLNPDRVIIGGPAGPIGGADVDALLKKYGVE